MRSDQRQSSRRGYNNEKGRTKRPLQAIARNRESGSLHETFEGEICMYNGRGLCRLGMFVRIINANQFCFASLSFRLVFAFRHARYSLDSLVLSPGSI